MQDKIAAILIDFDNGTCTVRQALERFALLLSDARTSTDREDIRRHMNAFAAQHKEG